MSLYVKERPEYLRQSLDSVFNQTVKADEVVLVEDGPITEELDSVVREFQAMHLELKVVPLPTNGGLGNALNEGLKHCTNELIARMDTDDIASPDRFQRQVSFMESHPEIDICGSWLQEFEDNVSNILSVKKVPETHEEISEYIKSRNPLNHPSVIFKKQAVIDSGGYKPFPLFEDYFLWARMMVNGCKFANIPECLVNFRVSPDMYKRRGGLKYAIDSTKFQWYLHKLGLISSFAAIKASILRGSVYILPNSLRSSIYSHFLRS